MTTGETLILFGGHSSYFSHDMVISAEVRFDNFRPFFDSSYLIYFLYVNALRSRNLYYIACFTSLTDILEMDEGAH